MCALAATLYRLFVRRLHAEFYVWPDRRAAAGALGKSSRDDSDLYLAQYRRVADLARNWRPVMFDVTGRLQRNDGATRA